MKALDEFNRRSDAQDGRQSACRACSKARYLAYADVHRARVAARNATQRAEVIEHLVQYLVCHPCVDCGQADLRVLEFDHRSGSEKTATVSVLIRLRRPWAEVLAEVLK